ncbi:hypothetical protein SRHO_G00073790 [Serrasalmus rhombeus]
MAECEINEPLPINDKLFRRRPPPAASYPELYNSRDFYHICLEQCTHKPRVLEIADSSSLKSLDVLFSAALLEPEGQRGPNTQLPPGQRG